METTVQRLRYVLEVLAPAVSGKKATLPVLKNVVVGQRKAYATNLETAITVEFPEATEDPMLLPHAQLLALLRKIPGPMPLSINREGQVLKLTAGATSAEFPVPAEASEFPPLPKLQPVGEGQVDADLFLKTATALAPYAATDESRPTLQCVCITLGAPLEMAGADGFRLAWQTIPMALPALNSPVIDLKHLLLPTEAVETLAKVWKVMEKQPTVDAQSASGGADPLKEDGGVRMARLAVARRMATIQFSNIALSFQHGAVTVRTHLGQGQFPDYHTLIPTSLPHKVSFDAEEALRAVRSLQDIANEGSGILRLTWSDSALTISAVGEVLGAITVSVRAHIQGGEGNIAFDVKYLAPYLAGKVGMVLLETSTVSSPARFFHIGSPDLVLMPMFVKWGDEAEEPAPEQPDDYAPPEADEEPAPEPPPAAAKPRTRARRSK